MTNDKDDDDNKLNIVNNKTTIPTIYHSASPIAF